MRRAWTRAVLCLVVFVLSFTVKADIVSNCFKVVSYGVNWHVECTLDGYSDAVDIAIDDNVHNGWRALDHGSRGFAYLSGVESGEVVDAGTFIRMTNQVEYVDQSDFIVAFAIGCSEPMHINGNFGWVHLAYEGGTIVLKGGAINTTRSAALVAEGGVAPSIVNPETGCETNTFYTTSEFTPHILHRRDSAFDFVIFNYTESCWGISVNHSSGRGYVAVVPAGTYVGDATFSQQRISDGYSGDMFFMAFKWWPDANDTTRHTRYGWMAIGLKDGAPAILASEMSETEGAPLVGRAFEGVDDGPDEAVDGLIWRCNFNNGVQWMDATNMPEVASHVLLAGTYIEALIDDGRYSGRRCAEIAGSLGERAWFSVNERSGAGLGPRYVPAKWQSLKTSFKMYSSRAWEEQDGGLYAEMPPSPGEGNTRGIQIVAVPGTIVNIDDKIALRYCEHEAEYIYEMDDYWWEVNAGMTNGVGTLEARAVRLVEKERGDEPTSPIRNWVSIDIEAVNDGSPHGLAYRIYIDGKLVCSEEDGATVFRARPVAADKGGVTALGIGGDAFIDDVVFSSTTIDPLADVDISPNRFGPANEPLTADELGALAGIIGFESLSGLERITMYPWEDDSGCEPLDAPKMCIDLGISASHVKPDSEDGKGLTLFFRYPTVMATGIDPTTSTVTGRIIPAEGSQVVYPPQRFMFGINQHVDFGTPYEHIEEYGYSMLYDDKKFRLDTSDYAVSNGVFTIHYDPKLPEPGSTFFSLEIKDFRY